MRNSSSALVRVLLASLAIAVATRADAQSPAAVATPHATSSARAVRAPAGYSEREADFVVGKAVYLRSTKTRVGTIESADESHAFPRSFPHSPAKAVLIRRTDGPRSWVPVAGITRVYVVDR